MPSSSPLLRACDLGFAYPGCEEPTIDEIDLELAPGEVVGLCGVSGAGKTTLARLLLGVAPALTGGERWGDLTIDGGDPSTYAEVGKLGALFADPGAQVLQFSAIAEVMTPLLNQGLRADEARERAEVQLARFGLTTTARVWDLNRAETTLLALAASCVTHPRLLYVDPILDELPAPQRDRVWEILSDQQGAVLIATHDSDRLAAYANRILVMEQGKLVVDTAARDVLADPELRARADLAGPSIQRLARRLGCGNCLSEDELRAALPSARLSLKLAPVPESFGRELLRVQDIVTRDRKRIPGLKRLNLTLQQGEIHVLAGGEQTDIIVRLFSGALRPESGSIQLCGEDFNELDSEGRATRMGIVLREPDHLLSERTVRHEIEASPGWHEEVSYSAAELSRRAGLNSCLLEADPTHLPHELRRQVALAFALAGDPDVLVLQEPFVELGHRARQHWFEAVRAFARDGAVLIVSNDPGAILELANGVSLLEDGALTSLGPPLTALRSPQWQQAKLPGAAVLAVADELGIGVRCGDR